MDYFNLYEIIVLKITVIIITLIGIFNLFLNISDFNAKRKK